MTEPSRWVVVDDRDSLNRIRYSEGWQSITGDDHNNLGNFGETYLNSLHATDGDGAEVLFSFRGNAARIKGTTDAQIDPVAGVPYPDWDCILDGKVVRNPDPVSDAENNWAFCEFGDLVGGDHTVGLKVKTTGRSLWIDYIEYRPTGEVDNEVIRVTRADDDLLYSAEWAPLANTAHSTTTKGSNATFTFIGTGVSIYGMYSKEMSHASGQATYAIDCGPSTTITIPGGGNTSMFNRKILEVDGLRKQAHIIVLTYASDGGSTPLTVSQILVQGGTNLRALASGSGCSGKRTPVGAIVGSVLGGVVALLLLFVLVWYLRRKRARLRGDAALRPFSLTSEVRTQAGAAFVQHPAARSKCINPMVPENPGHTDSSIPSVPSRAIIHEDSGVRIPAEGTEAVVELPPSYTVS